MPPPDHSSSSPDRPQAGLISQAFAQVPADLTRRPAVPPVSIDIPGYELLGELHRGGQGVVYRALQQTTGRPVAIKLMHGGPLAQVRNRPRFEREVRVLARLRHPNIVSIIDSRIADGHAYFVMDLIAGQPLDRRAADVAHPLTLRQRLELFAVICEAVNAAHLRGVIHRDLKPGNILIDEHDQPHVLDFGLAKLMRDDSAGDGTMTETGQFVGSLPWASPEQAEGRLEQVDLRTDVYALGVIAYHLLTGHFPYPVNLGVARVIHNILNVEPVRPSAHLRQIDEEIETILLKCLSKAPERRYETAGQVAREVRRYLAGEPIEAKRDSGFYVLRKHLRRHRLALGVIAAFVLTLAGSSVVAWSLYGQAQRANRESRQALRDSLLQQARAARASLLAGRRDQGLAALAQAARIEPSRELRDEAVACMILPDLQPVQHVSAVPFPTIDTLRSMDRLAFETPDGAVAVHTLAGAPLARIAPPPEAGPARYRRFSPDGRFLALRYDTPAGYRLQVHDLERAATCLDRPAGEMASVGLAFGGPDAAPWIAVSCTDGTVRCYDLPGGTARATIAPGPGLLSLAGEPGGTRLAVFSRAQPARAAIWDVSRGTRLLDWEPASPAFDAAWHTGANRIAVAGTDHLVHLLDPDSGDELQSFRGHTSPVTRVLFNDDGARVASDAWDGTVRLWERATARELFDPLEDVSLIANGPLLATADAAAGELQLWRYQTASPCRRFSAPRRFGDKASVDFDERTARVLMGGLCGVRLRGLDDEHDRVLTDATCHQVMFDPAGDAVLVIDEHGLWRWPERAPGAFAAPQPVYPDDGLRGGELTPDGSGIILVADDLRCIDLASGALRWQLPGYVGMERPSVTRDGRYVFTAVWGGAAAARVLDLETGATVATFPGHSVRGRFSPDGRWLVLATGPDQRIVDTRDWSVRRVIARKRTDYGPAGPVAITPDSTIAVVPYSRYELRMVEIETGRILLTLPNPDLLGFIDLRFARDRDLLLAATVDRTLVVWDLRQVHAQLERIGLGW